VNRKVHKNWAARAGVWLGQHPGFALLLTGLVAFVFHAGLSLLRFPVPGAPDGFSNLLAADTFARGRMTNPTHLLWPHFETNHVIQRPSYQSAYPPGMGLLLAAGQVLGGHPVVGLWLGAALTSWAVGWMLLGWLPTPWALAGALMAAFHPGIAVFWHQRYFGGTVAMIGGALLFGGLRRVFVRPSSRNAAILGLGLVVLANSRPYEGLVASLPAAGVLLVWAWRRRREPALLLRVMLPLTAILAVGGVATALYNARVTGDAFRMPYQVHEATYAAAPNFLWQSPRPVVAPHDSMRAYQEWRLRPYREQQSVAGLAAATAKKVFVLVRFYLATGLLLLPLLALPWVLRDRWMRFGALCCSVTTVAILALKSVAPQYAAPIAAVGLALWLEACRHFVGWTSHGRAAGKVVALGMTALLAVSPVILSARERFREEGVWYVRRAAIAARLRKLPGEQLVLVRYGQGYSPPEEWVYNGADIDGAKVVWARELDAASNRRLLHYFNGRHVWLLEVGGGGSRLTPYRRGEGFEADERGEEKR
jgi:hypothetical protein